MNEDFDKKDRHIIRKACKLVGIKNPNRQEIDIALNDAIGLILERDRPNWRHIDDMLDLLDREFSEENLEDGGAAADRVEAAFDDATDDA